MSWSIQVEGLSKQYKIGNAVTPALDSIYQIVERKMRSFLRQGAKPATSALLEHPAHVDPNAHLILTKEQQEGCPENHFWALRDVSFEIKEGDRVGVVGRNGSGKSTLLKILSRITSPTSGEFRFRGRLISLLEVGTGFHPDLTGRENIIMNAKINGMSSKGIDAIFDDIVDFSELGQQIDTPIKRYSSGMYMRLAFSVAAHLESEILIVDEVLAVGDAGFQKKCLDKMLEVSGRGRTLLFVSHDMNAISALCTKALELSHGMVVHDQPHGGEAVVTPTVESDRGLREVSKAISGYVMNGQVNCEMQWNSEAAPKFKNGDVRINSVRLSNGDRIARDTFDITDAVFVHVQFEVLNAHWKLNAHIYLKTMTGQQILMSMDNQSVATGEVLERGIYNETCVIPANCLNEGGYRVEVVICTNPTTEQCIVLPDVLTFTMGDNRLVGSVRGDWTREWPQYPIRQHLQWTKEF